MADKHKHEGAVAAPSDRPETASALDRNTGKVTGEVSTKPTDLGDYKGSYHLGDEKEPYGLKVVEDEVYGRTHLLKNVEHFWAGTEAEFKDKFNQKDKPTKDKNEDKEAH
jgi:hypothetical protein